MATKNGSRPYQPDKAYPVTVREVEYRGRGPGALLARMYQPQGPGPFPALVDVHGGAWHAGHRGDNELIDQAMAAAGMVVMAVDYRLAPGDPYPAQVQDVNYAVRWLKAHAARFNATPDCLGGLGTSAGAHTLMLSAMRPYDPRYAGLELAEAPDLDATVAYVLALWPVLDPHARYLYARDAHLQSLVRGSDDYFLTEETMQEGNPQGILDRGEPVELPPVLIVQPYPDINIPRAIPERFTEAYQKAGGRIELRWFQGVPHGFARTPGRETQKAFDTMKDFVSRQLGAMVVRGA